MFQSKQISYMILISLYLPEPELACCMLNLFVWEITLKLHLKVKTNDVSYISFNLFDCFN